MPSKFVGHVPDPVEVEYRSKDRELRIAWADEHESRYPVRYLRGYCPCAHCQGHGSSWNFVENDGPGPTAIGEVGNYALSIEFAGGHKTGIYSFEILRQLCPCEACQELQGPVHPWRRMPGVAGG